MGSKRIILADDEAYVTTTLSAKLRAAGHEVTVACNGEEAFQLAGANPPDLLVTDYQMPVLSGYEMSVKLKGQPLTSGVPVLMLTARGHHLSPEQLSLTNIRAVLAKPFSAREVVAKVNELLAAASAPTALASRAAPLGGQT